MGIPTEYDRLEYIGRDENGTSLFYNPDAKYPNSPYLVVYNETEHGATEPEELPLQIGRVSEHGINGPSLVLMLMMVQDNFGRIASENPVGLIPDIYELLSIALDMCVIHQATPTTTSPIAKGLLKQSDQLLNRLATPAITAVKRPAKKRKK